MPYSGRITNFQRANYAGSAAKFIYQNRKPIGKFIKSAANYGKDSLSNRFSNNKASTSKKQNPPGKKKSIHQHAINAGTPGSFSSFYYTSRKIPRPFSINRKALSKNYYVLNNAARITGAVGIQQALTVQILFGNTDVVTIAGLISANVTNKFLLKSVSSEIMLMNQDNGVARVMIYDIMARRDLASSANIADPLSAWQNSLADQGAANANWNVVGALPFSSDLFTQYFRVSKVTHLMLAQGQGHTHRIKFSPNKIVDEEYIRYNPSGFKGLTCFQVIVQHGMPYNDSTTKTQVSTGGTNIDVITKKQYSYTWMQDNDTNFVRTNNLPASFTVAEDIMSEATGTASAEIAA